MTSRGLLWLALGALSLPLFVEGISGCSFQASGIATPINDNAYTCACQCGDNSPHINKVLIAAGPDDVEQEGTLMRLDGQDLDLGASLVGLRFRVGIPPAASIQSANVQFTAADPMTGTENAPTVLQIVAELSPNAAPFTTADNDLSNRTVLADAVAWTPGAWNAGASGAAQLTPDLSGRLQELVNLDGWTTESAVVLRFQGTGQRSAVSRETNAAQAAFLQVTYVPAIRAALPICATPDIVAQNDASGVLPQADADADCQGRVAATLAGLVGACGFPSQCSCELAIPASGDATFDRDVCDTPCTQTLVDGTCSNFNPNAFAQCVIGGATEAACAGFVSATNAPGGTPVCLAAGGTPAIAARLFGRRSTCEVEGTSQIAVGDREPTKDPATTGIVDILGNPCPGGGCRVAASFGLAMDPITFSVRFASDPMFNDLTASGDSRAATTLDGIDATFAEDAIEGTGNGRRGAKGLAVNALNQQPLTLGVDWSAGLCDLNGNLASTVDGENPDGTCDGDGSTLCTADSPDCDEVGGPCDFAPDDDQDMTVNVSLAGALVNQPPAASAGADQTLECTSTAGASFTLQGTATDPDQNVAITSWLSGSRIGPAVGQDLALTQSLGVGAQQTFVLRVIDTFAQAAEDDAQVRVVDTTAPQLSLSVSPARLTSPNHKLVLVTATLAASDTCDANPTIRLVSITSNEPDNGLGDGDQPQDTQGAAFGTDDRQFLLRNERSGTGRGRVYTITYSATDASGNVTPRQVTVTVPR